MQLIDQASHTTYPPHGSPNNQKETKSQGSPCDSTINHKETISHGAHDINQCTMTIQLTPLNNYLSNCIFTSNYTPSYTLIDVWIWYGHGSKSSFNFVFTSINFIKLISES